MKDKMGFYDLIFFVPAARACNSHYKKNEPNHTNTTRKAKNRSNLLMNGLAFVNRRVGMIN